MDNDISPNHKVLDTHSLQPPSPPCWLERRWQEAAAAFGTEKWRRRRDKAPRGNHSRAEEREDPASSGDQPKSASKGRGRWRRGEAEAGEQRREAGDDAPRDPPLPGGARGLSPEGPWGPPPDLSAPRPPLAAPGFRFGSQLVKCPWARVSAARPPAPAARVELFAPRRPPAPAPARPPLTAHASMCSHIVIYVHPRRGIFFLLNEDLTREQVWIIAGLGKEEGDLTPSHPAPCPCVTQLGLPGAAGPGAAAAAAAADDDGGCCCCHPGSSLRHRPHSSWGCSLRSEPRPARHFGSEITYFFGKHITNQSRSLRLIAVPWKLLLFFVCCIFFPR